MNDEIRKSAGFQWTPSRSKAALALAQGRTQREAAEDADVADRTIRTWLQDPEFSAEVDRLTLITSVATRAERLRIAMRAVRQAMNDDTGAIATKADILDWLKFVQSETDGSRSDLAEQLAAIIAAK